MVRAKVKMVHVVELVVEAQNEDEIQDWLNETTPEKAYELSKDRATERYFDEIVQFATDEDVNYVINSEEIEHILPF